MKQQPLGGKRSASSRGRDKALFIRLQDSHLNTLALLADRLGVTRTVIIERALDRYAGEVLAGKDDDGTTEQPPSGDGGTHGGTPAESS